MPILLLGLETEVSEWRPFLEGIEEAVFCCSDSNEALLVLEECEKLGTPVGLVVVVGRQWTGQVGEAIERIRTKANE